MSENIPPESTTAGYSARPDGSEPEGGDMSSRRRTRKRHRPPFDAGALTRAASDALTVRRVFGEAYERGDTWVIPVAKMMGGTGSGSGVGAVGGAGSARGSHGPQGEGEGSGGGGGFGVRVRPIGVYVIDDSGVHWRPALDLNRVILGGQAVGIAVSLTLAWALRRRRH